MSRKILLSHYGRQEPITLSNHDPLFEIIAGTQAPAVARQRQMLTAEITFALDDELARRLNAHAAAVGARLFKHHKMMLCWFVLGFVRAKGKGHAMPSVEEFLTLHQVDEDEYATDSAYKLFQRFGWNFEEKNRRFSGRLRGNPSAELSRKKRLRASLAKPLQPCVYNMKDIDAELATARFLAAYSRHFTRTPNYLPKHARVYAYMTMQGLSIRMLAEKLGMTRSGVHNSLQSFRRRMERNPAVSRLMADAIALPSDPS